MANWLDKYNMNSNVAKTDATRVATPNLKLTKAQLEKNKAINKQVMAQTNKAKAEEIARRTAARNKPGKTISEVFTNKEPYNIQERFRLFPNDTEYGQVFDEYFNPVYFTAQMASDLANSLQSGDYKGAATTAGLALGVGALGFDPLGSAMKVPGKVAQSMESGLLSNTYKLNPWAFKPNPEAYYHRSPNLENVINKETGMLQGFGQSEAGKVYSANNAVTPTGTTINLKRGANSQLYFAKGTPLDFGRYNPSGQGYKGPYLIEAEGIPMGMSTKGSTPSVNPPTALGSYAVSHRPISANEVKFYKENWLQGYKPIEVPKFESEINWGKWNKEIPGNKSLMQEYKAIEQTSKADGTWMKNADGSAFKGTPEQFVQQQSSNFKKAFPQGVTKFYRGSNQHIDDFVNRQRADWALFGSDNPNVAKAYANTTEGPVNFYTPETSTEWGEKGLYELAFPNEAKIIEGQGGGRDFGLLDYNEQVAKGTRNPRMADVHNENLQYNWNNGNQYEYTAKMYDPAKRYLDTDSYANYVKNTNNPETVARIRNVIDGPKDLSSTVYAIDAERLPIKSLRYNNGMFDLSNPNIYKSVAPIIGAGVAASQFVDQKKNGGWLDKYNDGGPVQPNYNDASVTYSPDFVGDGYSNVGRNYSPAWGGQFEDGGELPIAQNGWLQKLENKVEGFMGRPMDRGTTYAHDDIRNKKSDELDTLRHAYTAIETSDAIKKATGNIPFISDQLAFVGTNALGAGHELTRLFKSTPDELRESGEDVINNFAGSLAGLVPFVSDSDKRKAIQYLSNKGILPDGTTAGRGRTYNVVNKKYAMGGSMPGAVGFTYARTNSPAPSNGPYAKKTKASAKDGIETTSSDPEVDTDIYSEINNSLFFNKNLINKNTVGSIKKEMSDYLRSPLYAQRQSNYPEQYTKVVEADDDQIKWIKGLNDSDEQKKYQDAIAKKKREERLHNLGTVPFNIHYKSIDPSWDELNPNSANVFDNSYDPNEERLHLSGRNFPSVVAHELSHATARTPTDVDSMYTPGANNENFRVDSDRLNTRYWDSITGKRKGTFNVGTGLNTSETNQFIDLAKPLSGESSYIDPHYNKNAERVDFVDEQYGDLNGVRHLLHSKGITKSFGENLDKAKLEKALKNKEIKDDPLFKRFHYRYGTDNLIKLNNTIAANDIQQGTPIAQNGIEMKYYQQGLDWKPKTISRDGSQLVKLDQLTNFTNYNTKQPPGGWLDKYQD